MANNISIDADFVINEQPDIQADLHINFSPDVSNFVTREELAEDLADKQDVLTAGDNIQIEDNVISATDTTYTAGEGISIENNVISNTQTSAEWGNIQGDIADQTDLNNLIDSKVGDVADDLSIEETARINADTHLQENIDTLSGTVTSNYNTLDGKIGDNKTAIDNHIADKNNPHEVTKSQVGLGNVDNTSDLNKPISTATQNALNGKANTSDLSTVATTGDYNDLSNKPTIPTVNDATLTIQKNGSNVATFTANSSTNQTANITVPTQASDIGALPDTTTINDLTTTEQQSALNSGATSTNIGQIATNTQNISNEVTNRQNADNALQSQIDALVVASDVFDIVGTYAELQAYDISTVPVNDIIKVLVDSTHNNAATYYRCIENDNVKSWSYIGAEGAYYTKSEADGRFVEQTTTINGQALSNNITLDAEDVGALPDTTTIGNGTLTIQKNGSTIDSFGANDTDNTTVNITVPTDTGDLTNNAGYIKGINSTDVTTALGYTPYDSSNPDGYTTNVGTVTSVNNTQPDANGNVTLSIPAAQVNSDWNASSGVAQILNKPTLSTVATSGDYNDLTNKPTIPTVNNATLTITQGGTTKGTFTANAGTDVTIDLDAGGGSSTDVQINGTSITSGGVADIITEGVYDATDNKIATMSELANKQDVLTAGTNINIVSVPPSEPVDTRSTATVQTVGSSNWQEVAYINGKFIAVGNNGNIMTSTDGETWETPYRVGSYTWRGIAYGNNTYVICGNNGRVAYSTDGENWTNTTAGTVQLNDVIFVNNTFIAISTDKHMATSSDGENWTVSQSTVFSNKPFDISYYNGVYIVTEESGKIETSTDLSTWTTVSVGSGTWNAVAYAFGKYVIAGAGGYMSYSTDLSTWATPFMVGTEDWQELVLGDGYLVAVGNSGNTSTTTDGETWTTVVTIGSDNWYGLACNGSNYVAVGVSGVTTTFEITNGQEGGTVINGAEIVSAIDSTSTNSQCVGAKLFYDTVGDIETALNIINSGVSA